MPKTIQRLTQKRMTRMSGKLTPKRIQLFILSCLLLWGISPILHAPNFLPNSGVSVKRITIQKHAKETLKENSIAFAEKTLQNAKKHAKKNVIEEKKFSILLPSATQSVTFLDSAKEMEEANKATGAETLVESDPTPRTDTLKQPPKAGESESILATPFQSTDFSLTTFELRTLLLTNISEAQQADGFVNEVKRAKTLVDFEQWDADLKKMFLNGEAVNQARYVGKQNDFNSDAMHYLVQVYSGAIVKYIPPKQRQKIYSPSGYQRFINVKYQPQKSEAEVFQEASLLLSEGKPTKEVAETLLNSKEIAVETREVLEEVATQNEENGFFETLFGRKVGAWSNDDWEIYEELNTEDLIGVSALGGVFYRLGGLWYPAICVDTTDTGTDHSYVRPAFDSDGNVDDNPNGNKGLRTVFSSSPTKVRGYYTFLYFLMQEEGIPRNGIQNQGNYSENINYLYLHYAEKMDDVTAISNQLKGFVSTTSESGDFVLNLFNTALGILSGPNRSIVDLAKAAYIEEKDKVNNQRGDAEFTSIGQTIQTDIPYHSYMDGKIESWNASHDTYKIGHTASHLTLQLLKNSTQTQTEVKFTVEHPTHNNAWVAYITSGGGQNRMLISSWFLPDIDVNIQVSLKLTGHLLIRKLDKTSSALVPNTIFKITGNFIDGSTSKNVTTNGEGISLLSDIAFDGTLLTVTEVEVPSPYILNPTPMTAVIESGKTVTLTQKNEAGKGKIKIEKSLEGYGQTLPNSHYSWKDLSFTITNSEGVVMETLTLDDTGVTTSEELPYGDYIIKEIENSLKLNHGQIVNPNSYSVRLSRPNQTTRVYTKSIEIQNTPQKGCIQIQKKISTYGETLPNSFYKWEGIKFEVKDESGHVVANLTLDNEGKAQTGELLLGTYTIHEVAPSVNTSHGQTVNTATHSLSLTPEDNTHRVFFETIHIENLAKRAAIHIQKKGVDNESEFESKLSLPNTFYKLEGAEYTITPKQETFLSATWLGKLREGGNVKSVQVDGNNRLLTAIFLTDVEGEITTPTYFPLGEYFVQETRSPDGMLLDEKQYLVTLQSDGTSSELAPSPSVSSSDELIYGETTLKKADRVTGEFPQGKATFFEAEYTLFYAEEMRNHKGEVIGMMDSPVEWTDEFQPTLLSGGSDPLKNILSENAVTATILEGEDTITVGHLPIGEYYWLETQAPIGYALSTVKIPVSIKKRGETSEFKKDVQNKTAYDDVLRLNFSGEKKKVSLKGTTIVSLNGIDFELTPLEGTQFSTDTNIQYKATSHTDETIIPPIDGLYSFENIPFGDYKLTELNPPIGYQAIEPLYIYSEFLPEEKEYAFWIIEGEKNEKSEDSVLFFCQIPYGELVDTVFSIPLRNLETVNHPTPPVEVPPTPPVFPEPPKTEPPTEVEVPPTPPVIVESPKIESPTPDAPSIRTTATNTITHNHHAEVNDSSVLVDLVEYTGLNPGKVYTIHGTLMSKETRNPLVVNDGKVRAFKRFKAENSSGSVSLSFSFSSKEFAGKSVVVFEELEKDGEIIALHKDIDDENQTVSFFESTLSTKASFSDGTKVKATMNNKEIVQDQLQFTNLVVGETYWLETQLVDVSSQKVIVMKGQELVPHEANPETTVELFADGELLSGRKLVFFETLYTNARKKTKVAEHAELLNSDQTIEFGNERGLLPDTLGVDDQTQDLPNTGEITNFQVLILGFLACLPLLIQLSKHLVHQRNRIE
ncbi:MAG: VaFE repeat-containing surface-anchored protein [Streptococcaceae bacterium]|nr:VaFE repeat-containing surface-anchored protein [Streptococcaceae bacterium]